MKSKFALVTLAALVAGSSVTVSPAFAFQDYHHDRHDDRDYRGNGGDYHHKCGGGNGAVGTVAGGAGGALAGHALGGGTLGTVAGGVGGALLGRHFDKQHTRHKNGC